jgi:hypothetical protein
VGWRPEGYADIHDIREGGLPGQVGRTRRDTWTAQRRRVDNQQGSEGQPSDHGLGARRDRIHGQLDCNADTGANRHACANRHGDARANGNADTRANRHARANANGNADTGANGDPIAHRHARSNSHGDAKSHNQPHPVSDANALGGWESFGQRDRIRGP